MQVAKQTLMTALILAALAWSPFAVRAAEVETQATGQTQEQAILDAITGAVDSVNRERVAGNKVAQRKYDDQIADMQRGIGQVLDDHADLERKIVEAGRGLIRDVKIGDRIRQGDNWTTQVKVDVVELDPASIDNGRTTIAVLPLRRPHATFQMGDKRDNSKDIARRLSHRMVSHLVKTRRFTVLDRDFVEEVIGERAMHDAEIGSDRDHAELGKRLGADFVLVGSLEDASIRVERGVVKLTGYEYAHYDARMNVGYRLINVETGEVTASDNTRVFLGDRELRQLAGAQGDLRADDVLIEETADSLVTTVVDSVHPVKVVKARSDGTVIVNRGTGRIEVGEQFGVFTAGESLIDPDTGEDLGSEEVSVARIVITRVAAKVAYARVIEGDPTALRPGSVVRRVGGYEFNAYSPD